MTRIPRVVLVFCVIALDAIIAVAAIGPPERKKGECECCNGCQCITKVMKVKRFDAEEARKCGCRGAK